MDKYSAAAIPLVLLLGVVQIMLGFIGIEHFLGWIPAAAAIFALFKLRLMLPLMISCFLGATFAMGWPWWLGLLIAAPGLLFIAPAAVAAVVEAAAQRS